MTADMIGMLLIAAFAGMVVGMNLAYRVLLRLPGSGRPGAGGPQPAHQKRSTSKVGSEIDVRLD